MIRTESGCSVSRFAELVDVPRRTYHGRLARHRAGDPPKGPWPAPVVSGLERQYKTAGHMCFCQPRLTVIPTHVPTRLERLWRRPLSMV